MKKIHLLFVSLLFTSVFAQAQIDLTKYSQSYYAGATDKPTNFGLVAAITEINNSFWNAYPNSRLQGLLQNDNTFQHGRPKEFIAINTFDTAKAHFFLHGITPANAGEYEYRVLIWPGKTLVPWTAISQFTGRGFSKTSGWPQMAYLGGYSGKQGDWLVVDLRKKNSNEILETAVVAWVTLAPSITDVYTPDELNLFLKRLARPWSTNNSAINTQASQEEAQHTAKRALEPHGFTAGSIENNLIFQLNADIYSKEQLEYQVVRNRKILIPWKANDFDNGFIWLRDLQPGEYILWMRYTAQRKNEDSFAFMIKAPWYQSVWFKIIIWALSAVVIGFVVFWILLVKQRRKTAEEISNKTKLQLELKSIYSQLNPHFIFNSLSSIQGLINKQDIDGANKYLADFAKLMRETLSNGNNDHTSLKQETVILETYLKLEQLRFGFRYDLIIDENIPVYDTDIPSLLLQPLVENAVKHGVSGLDARGTINIIFKRDKDDMRVTITDNGAGFPANKAPVGFGLKLTNDRITLLNELKNDQPILLDIKGNSPSGTKVYLTFKNWFL